jgi:DNA modification methylase
VCGDCLNESSYEKCLQSDQAQQVITDPPYNVRIAGHAMGRGRVKHADFAMASGEMSSAEFVRFLETCMTLVNAHVSDGSIHHYFMDWRHIPEITTAGGNVRYEWKNLLVWVKTNAGQGSFYRSQHELVCVFKHGLAEHINNFGLGATGRYRTNVLQYPSVNSLHPARRGDLALHPTVKPVALVADLIRDCSRRNGLILDPFGGSGTTLIAAERTGRAARLIEIEPRYVDLTIRRWESLTGKRAVHRPSGATFEEMARQRHAPKPKAATERVRVRR